MSVYNYLGNVMICSKLKVRVYAYLIDVVYSVILQNDYCHFSPKTMNFRKVYGHVAFEKCMNTEDVAIRWVKLLTD